MAIVVSCCIGVLTSVFMAGVLPGSGGWPERVRTPQEVGDAVVAWMVELSRGFGAILTGLGLPPEGVRTMLVGEVRQLRVRDREPFAGFGGDAALGAVVLLALAASALVGVLAWSPLGALVGFVAPFLVLWLRASSRARATESKVAEAMPEAFRTLSISLESGLSLPQAMRYVGGHSEEPVRGEFMRASHAMSCGVPAADALDDMVDRLDAPGLELVSLALKISKRTGAPLRDLLAEASQLAGERIELARQLDVKTSQARMSAQIVAAMPVAMVALLSLLSSDFRSGLATTTGALSVGIAMLLNVLAWAIIRKIMKVEL